MFIALVLKLEQRIVKISSQQKCQSSRTAKTCSLKPQTPAKKKKKKTHRQNKTSQGDFTCHGCVRPGTPATKKKRRKILITGADLKRFLTKEILTWPMKTKSDNAMNQSQLKTNTGNRHQARENWLRVARVLFLSTLN